METTAYKVKTEQFEGPLDLLLHLIEKRKLLINDISLSQVTEDFIEYIRRLEGFPISETAQFILVASTLLLIKSKSLLPVLELTPEEEGDIADLEKRLEQYKKFKELSSHLSRLFGKRVIFARQQKYFEVVFSPTQEISSHNLREAVRRVLKDFPLEEETLPKVAVKKVLSLEEVIENITERIKKGLKVSFKDLSAKVGGKENVIVSFLALLELFKRGVVEIIQEKHFEEITITNKQN